MKVLLYDVETSYITAYVHTLFPDRISPSQVKHDWHMLSAAWKWAGRKKVSCAHMADRRGNPRDDLYIVKRLSEAMYEADAVVAHNGDNFDIKKLRARMMVHGLPPLPPLVQIDTLKEVRRQAKFTSNKLDYLCRVLCTERKMENEPGLWNMATEGNKDAIRRMAEYNMQDVVALEDLYKRLVPTIEKLNHGLFVIDAKGMPVAVCPHCASPDCRITEKTKKTRTAAYPLYQCESCGGWAQGKRAAARAVLR